MGRFSGKVVLITGATSGIGRATALAFAREGANVVISGRREAEGAAVVRELEALGARALFVQGDVTRESDVEKLVQATVETFGRLDIAFNNAGIDQDFLPLTATSEEVYDRVMDINVKGVFLSLKHEIAAMLRTGGGAIVNNASIFGMVGVGNFGPYVASKFAVVGLTRSAALELAQSGIRVNAVAPGATQTDMIDRVTTALPKETLAAMHPMGRLGTPEEIASAVLWLSDPTASFVTGQVIAIDGGFVAQ